MRDLLILRGAPGCGKSTFITSHHLEPYTLSSDALRLLYRSPILDLNGKLTISQSVNSNVWNTLFEMLETRLGRGDFTVIDATFSKTEELQRVKNLALKYRYRLHLVDFTDVSIDECRRRNRMREELRVVPDEVIDCMAERFATEKIPSGFNVIRPHEIESVNMQKINLSQYEKIIHIGDIHGCYTVLGTYLEDLNSNYCYIFTGDFLDRGSENAQVLRFLLEIYAKPNVLLIEGNHERHLVAYCRGDKSRSREFESRTRPQLDAAGLNKHEIRKLCRKLRECVWYQYHDKEIFVSHGGISSLANNSAFIPSEQIIKGVGTYEDYLKVAQSWDQHTDKNCYQIFGHRNTERSPMCLSGRCFCLEGKVEHGGSLRALELDNTGFKEVEIRNKATEAF